MTRTCHILTSLLLLSVLLIAAGCPYERDYAEDFKPRFIDQPRVQGETVFLTVYPTELYEKPNDTEELGLFEPKVEKTILTADGRDVYWPTDIVRRFDPEQGWTQTVVFTVVGNPQIIHVELMVNHISNRFRMEADLTKDDQGQWVATYQEVVRTQMSSVR